ncbi:Molybdopterin oxidoreductase, chain C [Desulfitobacterium hafniense]|uniref:Molybdopterin oxidoreductase, chain C n=2 Tax=Desulfitobacterium hafniense TaxID=49338 RepID=A0A098B716_DESHA|nr:Molybdopterin oxidoreductase, chain C [Desulfitobacterium hafniense]
MLINIVCIAVILIGAWAWFRGYAGRPGSAHLDQYTVWGLYITLFLFLEATGVGAMFIAAVSKDLKYRLQLALAGVVSLAAASLAIMADLGGIGNSWRMFLTPNLSSPIFLDVLFLSLALLCGLFFIVTLSKGKQPKISAAATALMSVLLPFGTAILFITLPGRMGWSSSLEVAVFLAQAALAGLCCFIILGYRKFDDFGKLSKWLMSFLIINLALIVGEITLSLYDSGIESLPLRTLMTGEYAILFWLWIIGGLVCPIVMTFYKKSTAMAAGLGLGGILLAKFLFVIKGNMYPFLRAGQGLKIDILNSGLAGHQKVAAYIPTFEECLVAFAVVAFMILAYNLLSQVFAKTTAMPQNLETEKEISG